MNQQANTQAKRQTSINWNAPLHFPQIPTRKDVVLLGKLARGETHVMLIGYVSNNHQFVTEVHPDGKSCEEGSRGTLENAPAQPAVVTYCNVAENGCTSRGVYRTKAEAFHMRGATHIACLEITVMTDGTVVPKVVQQYV